MHKHVRGIGRLCFNVSVPIQLIMAKDMAVMMSRSNNRFQQPSDIFVINKRPRPKKMAAAAVSSLIGRASPSSSSLPVSVPAKLRHSPILRTLFAAPLSSTRHVRMAHSISPRATLGLTKPGSSVVPQVLGFTPPVRYNSWKMFFFFWIVYGRCSIVSWVLLGSWFYAIFFYGLDLFSRIFFFSGKRSLDM